tara:strand:- start:212 stop:640 length:429 start_codon:yes stop_codon:yes gene_type:complete
MPKIKTAVFGNTSQRRLDTCHEEFKEVMTLVIAALPYTDPDTGVEIIDCGIICGERSEQEQEEAYRLGNSKARFGESLHNTYPSNACDTLPMRDGRYIWDDKELHAAYAKLVLDTAWHQGYRWKWGGDFESFYDGPHFERAL